MDRIEQKIIDIIERNAEKIISFGNDIWHHAELGFEEFRTSGKFCEVMNELGLTCEKEIAITGVKSFLKEKKDDEIRVALMGEMDALPFDKHVDANPETGAAHCCGHNAQLTGVIGAALALTDPEVKEALGGNIAFIAVPAEECGSDPEYQRELLDKGKIRYLGGKCEFIRLGAMDDIDITLGHHIMGDGMEYGVGNSRSMGFIDKHITYTGVTGHPGFAYKTVDALAAANLAMHAVDVQREGINHFEIWNKHILHGFIRNGGSASNIVTDKVEMEYNMRGMTTDSMLDIAYRVDRALKGAAIATGAGLEVKTVPGYMPTCPIKDPSVITEVFEDIDTENKHKVVQWTPDTDAGTSDFGDLSCIMPVLQFYTGGQSGDEHTLDFRVEDQREYYLTPAKCFALAAYKLLKNNAERARKILEENEPIMTKETYCEFMDSLFKTEKIELTPAPDYFKK